MFHLLFNYRIILSFITYQPKSKPTPQITSSPNFDSEIIQGKKQTQKIADIFDNNVLFISELSFAFYFAAFLYAAAPLHCLFYHFFYFCQIKAR